MLRYAHDMLPDNDDDDSHTPKRTLSFSYGIDIYGT